MKKIIMTAVAAVTVSVAIADRTPAELMAEIGQVYTTNRAGIAEWRRNVTEGEWRAYGDWAVSVAATNRAAASASVTSMGILGCLANDINNDAFVAEMDKKLADAGIGCLSLFAYAKTPKVVEVAINDPSNAVEVAKLRASIANCRRNGRLMIWQGEIGIPERANIVTEMFRSSTADIGMQSDIIVQQVSRVIKRRMRETKMKIISENGVNPVQVELDKLTAAFNAPRFAGLKEWFARLYPEYTWIDSAWETDAEIEELKDKVFNGDVPFGVVERNILRANLGVEKYNEFVNKYNN